MIYLTKWNIFLTGIFVLMIFVGMKIFRMDFPITNFDNLTIGLAAAKNIDISKAILWYTAYVVALCSLFAWLLKKSALYDKIKNFFCQIEINKDDNTLFLMMILLSFLILGVHDTGNLIFAFGFALIILFSRDDEAGVTAWLSSLYIFAVPIFCFNQYFSFLENAVEVIIIAMSIYFCLAKNFSKIFATLYPFLIAGIFSLILLNVLEILLVRGWSVDEKILIVPYILAAATCIFFKPNPKKNYQQKILRGTIILMVLSVTPALGVGGYIDFFEISNHGLSIQDFVNYGELPLINNLDAHMLSINLGGIIWFALTGDYVGSIFTPYSNMIQLMIGLPPFFYLLTRFLTERQAIIFVMFFPLLKITSMLPGLIVLSAFIFWKNNPNFFRSLIVQITTSALCLYRIDLGASFGVALFAVPILFCLIKRKYPALTNYILSAILWAAIFFSVVFFGLHFEFAEEFFTAFRSNQHWAYGDLGETTRVTFLYFIIPAIMAILFLPVARRIWSRYEFENDWLILLLYFAFIFGLQRIIVRHTFMEYDFSPLKILLLSTLAASFCKVYKATVFTGIFFIFIACFTNLNQLSGITTLNSIAGSVYSVHNQQRQYFAYFTEEDKSQIELMKNFFDENLRDDETYFDFTNQSLFFVATGRKNPIYINQCPAMINGVKGQLQALDEIKKSKVKFVAMPYLQRPNVPYSCYTHIDGILNCDRYYLLTEWICKNYQPYQSVGNFFVWKLKDSLETELLNYNYETPENHFHNLGYIPQLFGKSSVQSERIELSKNENGLINLKNVIGKIGFISIEISSDFDAEVQFKLKGDGINDIVWQFKITKGTHLYKFRASSDILWYSGKVGTLEVLNFHADKIYFEELKE